MKSIVVEKKSTCPCSKEYRAHGPIFFLSTFVYQNQTLIFASGVLCYELARANLLRIRTASTSPLKINELVPCTWISSLAYATLQLKKGMRACQRLESLIINHYWTGTTCI